ncbi:MAG TPA: UDP-N-acetylmuramoyl-L-alanine--D-glutamate ligase [Thermoanaerobaculia bacterium]|nr:UDP-N-acetylmuramoyl-L-alanine--D-glutamate ligase [Thermoanaerobaculia bacterium]
MPISIGPDLPEIARAAVFGLARSGRAALEALARRGVDVVATDRKSVDELGALPAMPSVAYVLGEHPDSLLDDCDLVVVSPGIPLALPVFDAARARAIPVVSEIELASRLLPGTVIGITGTNGKSTTTALAAALLKDAGRDAVACGNLGTPWISYALEASPSPGRVYVVELSSFQLEGIRRFAPDIAVHLNLTPDHLDRYRSLDDYGAAKARIFENQRDAQAAILNADDPLVARIRPRARRFEFSRRGRVERGAWLEEGHLLARTTNGPRVVAKREDLSLPGAHNVENALAALAATLLLGVPPESAAATLRSFRGLPHRTALVRQRGGVSYYNDSKGTNVDATLKSLEGFPDNRVLLIAGGKEKGDDFARLAPLAARKAFVVLTVGAAGEAIARAMEVGAPDVAVVRAETVENAVREAARLARPGDVVLLSPACASFDQFKNFEHRGEVFESLVRALPESARVGAGAR